MKFMAFVAVLRSFRIARRSRLPGIPESSRRRRSLNLLHLISTCITICLPSPQAHCGFVISGTPFWWRKSLRPIFSVRIWISRELCRLLRFSYKRRNLCVGFGVYLRQALRLVSVAQLYFHSFCTSCLIHVFSMVHSRYNYASECNKRRLTASDC